MVSSIPERRPRFAPKGWQPSDGPPKLRYVGGIVFLALVFLVLALAVPFHSPFESILWALCASMAITAVLIAFAPSNMWEFSPDYIPSKDRPGRFWRIVTRFNNFPGK